jgi:predicted enzyme related to lactoylglutathione lyase
VTDLREAPDDVPATSLAFTEMASEDPVQTRRFLERVFGWKFRSVTMPQGEYHSFDIPGGGRGGIRSTQPTEAPSSLSYVRVPDLERARQRVERGGATIVLPRVDVPGMGSFFWFRIPGGLVLACWQDAPPGPERER